MRRISLVGLAVALFTGCATPFDERWGDDHLRQGELPRWVQDSWNERPERAVEHNAQAAAGLDSPDSIEELIAWSLEHHPAVQAAQARWHAAWNRVPQARTLPEPELTYRVIVEQIDTDRSPVGHAVGISQMFPWFGTLEQAANVQAYEARAAGQRYVQQQLNVVSSIKSAWAEYAYLHQAAEVQRQQIDLLAQIESVVRTSVRTGQVPHRDLVRIEAEIDRLQNDLHDTQDMIVAAAAQLNAAAGRESRAALPQHPSVSIHSIEIDADQLASTLRRLNPSLEGLRHELAAGRHAKQLAEKRFYPEFMLGIEYGVDTSRRMAGMDGGGSDMLMGMVGLRLPIWHASYEAGVREAMAEWGATLRDLDDQGNTLEAELKMVGYRIRDAERRAALFGERLRIRSDQVLRATETAYRAGEATFTDLIEAQRELLEFELATHRAEADHFKGIAALEALVGQSLGAMLGVETQQ